MCKLAVLILTKNEESNVKACVENALLCTDEVIIIDSGSTDRTVEIAQRTGAKVCFRAWDNDFAAQRNFAIRQTNAELVLYLDADERLSEDMIASILKIIKGKNTSFQYKMARRTTAFGREFKYGVLRMDYVSRLFPRSKVKWEGKVHEKAVCDLPKLNLPGYIEHYTYESWQQYFGKLNQYTSLWAEEALKKGKRTTPAGAFAHASYSFFQMAFLKLGILDGWLGLALCCNHFNYTLTKYLKLYEIQEKE